MYMREIDFYNKGVDRIVRAIKNGNTNSSTTTNGKYNTEICMIDDVNGNSTLLIPYVKLISIDPLTGISTPIGDYDSNYNSYTPINPTLASSIGSTPILKQGRIKITAGTWSPTALTKSYTIRVKTLGTTAPTFKDSFNQITLLEQGETLTFGDSTDLMDVTPVLTVVSGSEVLVNYVTF